MAIRPDQDQTCTGTSIADDQPVLTFLACNRPRAK
jgi:hypothetical protein